MRVLIERKALDLTFRTLLSCQCPVTADEERGVFGLLSSMSADETLDYALVLAQFKPNANTVFRRLADFAVWMAPADSLEFTITAEHVIRHFASTYHWDQVVADGMTGAYKNVLSVPRWFLGHMLLPVRITHVDSEGVTAVYDYAACENAPFSPASEVPRAIELKHLFASDAGEPKAGEVWAVHFAALLERMTPEEEQLARMLTESNPLLVQFRDDVDVIDYKNFERHGDYRALCQRRYETYFA